MSPHSGLALARRLEACEAVNDAECTAVQSGAAVEPLAGGWLIFAGPDSPLTRALGLGLASRIGAGEFAEIERFFHVRGARVAIDICPMVEPGLLEWIRRRGYRPMEFNNTMVRLLAGTAPPADDPRVRPAATDEMDRWAETVGHGFFESGPLAEEEIDVGRAIFRMGKAECWFAEVEGEPAGGGALSMRDGVALCFADSVVPRRRRQGLHAALIRARLVRAIEAGCDLASAITQPGSASQRNYERLGFQVAYTKVLLAER